MKRSLTCSLAAPSSLQRLLVITPLFLGSALVSASPGTTPSDDLIPEFVLYQKSITTQKSHVGWNCLQWAVVRPSI